MSRMIEIYQHGQSIWLDYIERNLLVDGGLQALVNEGLRGVTSNPTIFDRAISNSRAYDSAIRDLIQADPEIAPDTLYEWLAIQDTRMAADILHPVWESSDGEDGYVSLEVSPHLARDTVATIDAAHHLWTAVNRKNLMIKVPATREGLPAIERLIGEGININVTLLFSVKRYQEVMDAYTRGAAMARDPGQVTSVASFFVSRIDRKIDARLERIGTPEAQALKGRIAVANAKVAYQRFKEWQDSEAFRTQQKRGARIQRLLWGSTSTKDPRYSDLLYVESLIGRNTVNTVPLETLDALQDHAEVSFRIEQDLEQAQRELATLESLGIPMDQVTAELEEEGVEAFAKSFDHLLASLADKRYQLTKEYAS